MINGSILYGIGLAIAVIVVIGVLWRIHYPRGCVWPSPSSVSSAPSDSGPSDSAPSSSSPAPTDSARSGLRPRITYLGPEQFEHAVRSAEEIRTENNIIRGFQSQSYFPPITVSPMNAKTIVQGTLTDRPPYDPTPAKIRRAEGVIDTPLQLVGNSKFVSSTSPFDVRELPRRDDSAYVMEGTHR